MAWWRRSNSLRCESIDMGQLPHVLNDEIVTYPVKRASGKMAPRCEISARGPDIFGGNSVASGIDANSNLDNA